MGEMVAAADCEISDWGDYPQSVSVAAHDPSVRITWDAEQKPKWQHAVPYVDESEVVALRAEVERLNELVRDHAECSLALRAEIERLRKGRDDVRGGHTSPVVAIGQEACRNEDQAAGEKESNLEQHCSVWRANCLPADSEALDHRLGLGLPDGEPVELMSAYSWRRST